MTAQSTLAAAGAAKAVQLAIRAQLLRDVTRLWPALDAKRLSETFPGWLRAMSLLARSYHGQSAEAASSFYRTARQEATQSPAPRALIRLAEAPPDEWMAKAFGFSGPGNLTRDAVRPNTALTSTLGTSSRIALDGGRTTIVETAKADPVAVGWYRMTDSDPCAFCAMLASRGIVYRTAESAGQDVEWHNDCGCIVVPAFTRDAVLPESSLEAQKVWSNLTTPSLKEFRKAWASRNAQPDPPNSLAPEAR